MGIIISHLINSHLPKFQFEVYPGNLISLLSFRLKKFSARNFVFAITWFAMIWSLIGLVGSKAFAKTPKLICWLGNVNLNLFLAFMTSQDKTVSVKVQRHVSAIFPFYPLLLMVDILFSCRFVVAPFLLHFTTTLVFEQHLILSVL